MNKLNISNRNYFFLKTYISNGQPIGCVNVLPTRTCFNTSSLLIPGYGCSANVITSYMTIPNAQTYKIKSFKFKQLKYIQK